MTNSPCSDCPFVRSTPLNGAPDWLEDIIKFHSENEFFEHSCHKSDPKADGYVGGKSKECKGHLMMMVNSMDETPGNGGVYNSISELAEKYLVKWLGKEEFEKMGKAHRMNNNLEKG